MDLIEEIVAPPKSTPPVRPPTDEEMSEFKAQVAEWVKIDDQIKKLRVATRERIVHQRALGGKVQEFMKEFKYDNLNTAQGRIRNNVREVKAPLKVGDIKTKLYELLEQEEGFSEELVNRIHTIFNASRAVTKKESLCRDIPKVSQQLDL